MDNACQCHDPGFILRLLYGAGDAERIESWLSARLAGFTPPALPDLGQQDVYLAVDPWRFTRMQKNGFSNLQAVLDGLPDGLFSGLHLLPFTTGTSSGALAVDDPLAVDPALGSWEDIHRLGERFSLAFDAPMTALSTASPAFKAFLRRQPPFDSFFLHKRPGEDGFEGEPGFTRYDTPAGPLAVYSTFGEGLADLNYAEALVFQHALDVLLTYIENGAGIIRLTDAAHLVKGRSGGLHLPGTHLLVRALRAVLDGTAPQVQLAAESGLLFSEPNWYIGNGFNEVHLAQHTPLMDDLQSALLTGDARRLTAEAASVALPCDRVTLYHHLPAAGDLPRAGLRALAAAGLSLVGVPSVRLSDLLVDAGGTLRLDDARLQALADLLRARRRHAAFHPHGAQLVLDVGAPAFALLRISPDLTEQALCLHNFSAAACRVDGDALADACGMAQVRDLLTGETVDLQGEVSLPGHAVWWLSAG